MKYERRGIISIPTFIIHHSYFIISVERPRAVKSPLMPKPELKPALLVILDGWGERGPFPDNAIALAPPENMTRLRAEFPSALLTTHGAAVGLPAEIMGNSEVGHMNIGAGRVVFQDLPRINLSIQSGDFFRRSALVRLFEEVRASGGRLHLLGLVSDGGVHSHIDHIAALLTASRDAGVRTFVHAFTDGRDTSPHAGAKFIAGLQEKCRASGATLASLIGRYFAMDRDKRWERVKVAYRLLTEGQGKRSGDAVQAVADSYAADITDEFVQPVCVDPEGVIRDGDGVLFCNFRADRARELSEALTDPDFSGFPRNPLKLAGFVTMTRYKEDYPHPFLFEPMRPTGTLGEIVAEMKGAQLRIAETEKYAHVTYFFSGGREELFRGEERIMVPSLGVATYDLQPEMSAPEVTARALAAIRSKKFSLIVLNYANADMVGHTGQFEAARRACKVVDDGVGQLVRAVREAGGIAIITADHGNAEEMHAEGGTLHTQHTLNPVPCIVVADALPDGSPLPPIRPHGALCDVTPTLLQLWGVAQGPEMGGRSLFKA
jgi:2,3-bisphosphoglycerate-independent phosphoglycerate mutase